MKILSMDTSSDVCSVALLENNNIVDELHNSSEREHSQSLMPMTKDLLEKNNISLDNIDLVTCGIGPGSFTGIRIGIATCKAFADSINIPCVGISSLEVVAYNEKNDGIICSTIDCKNDNCYFALYELIDGNYNILEEPCAKAATEVLDLLNTKYSNKQISFVGDGITSHSTNCYLNVENLGIAGYKKFIGHNNLGEDILPLYLKKPQAERQLEEKLNASTNN